MSNESDIQQLTEKYTDVQVVSASQVGNYAGNHDFRIIKEYGALTTEPRFMVGRCREDLLKSAQDDYNKLNLEHRELKEKSRNLESGLSRARDSVTSLKEAYNSEYKARMDVISNYDDLRSRTNEMESHLGILRDHVGIDKCKELLGK